MSNEYMAFDESLKVLTDKFYTIVLTEHLFFLLY